MSTFATMKSKNEQHKVRMTNAQLYCKCYTFSAVYYQTCSCLMVSPPLPMTRPTLLAGMRICWIELLPSMSLWKPGPYRHCSTISLNSLLACLWGWSEVRETHLLQTLTQKRLSLSNVKEVFRWFSDWLRGDVKRDLSSCPLCHNNGAHFPNALCSFSKSVKVERWDLLNVLWAPSQRAGPVQHASTVYKETKHNN